MRSFGQDHLGEIFWANSSGQDAIAFLLTTFLLLKVRSRFSFYRLEFDMDHSLYHIAVKVGI